jgi:hypothetical protein
MLGAIQTPDIVKHSFVICSGSSRRQLRSPLQMYPNILSEKRHHVQLRHNMARKALPGSQLPASCGEKDER